MKRWPLVLGALLLGGVGGYVGVLAASPRFIMGVAVDRSEARIGINRMTHVAPVTARTQTIVRPSPDLAYSSCPFDLAAGPLLIEVAPVPGHYWSLSVFDHATDTAFVRNDIEAKGAPVRIVLARPGQVVPAGAETVRLAGDRGMALVRVLLTGPGDYAQVDPIRRRSLCRPIG